MNRLKEIEQRKAEIRALLESDEKIDLDVLDVELKALEKEEQEIQQRQVMAAKINAGQVNTRKIDTPEDDAKKNAKQAQPDEAELRGKALKEKRSVTVGGGTIVLPSHQATDIKPTFNEVSSLVDRVNRLVLPGGESFTQPYLEGYGTGDYKAETEDYATAEPTFAYAEIGKAKVTAYAEDSEEVLKLPAANYDALVVAGITTALRRKITREILIGNGTTNHLTGIFDDGAAAIDAGTDLPLTEIDEETLDQIIYAFGGDEDVEDVAVLVLNKKDLKSFATLRDSEGRRIYEVVHRGNTGTIDGVPYVINSACGALAESAKNDYLMAYGPLSNYSLAIFSDIDVQRSTDYKFKAGMIAHRGSVFVGGNVTAKNGFLRIKKGA